MRIDEPTRRRSTLMAAFRRRASRRPAARARAATAVLDTIGVALAGASRTCQRTSARRSRDDGGPRVPCSGRARPRQRRGCRARQRHRRARARLRRHVLRVARASERAAGAGDSRGRRAVGASGRALLDAYVVGFEIQARLGRLMNPRHYQRGWHCTSTLGAISAAAAASRLLGLDAARTAHALAIAASSASGLKENFGTMVKPLHAGLAARDGVLAALLAKRRPDGEREGARRAAGFSARDGQRTRRSRRRTADLGSRWEILDTGITVKLYPVVRGHASDARRAARSSSARHGFTADDVDRVEIDVDSITPTILIYDRPASGSKRSSACRSARRRRLFDGRVGHRHVRRQTAIARSRVIAVVDAARDDARRSRRLAYDGPR